MHRFLILALVLAGCASPPSTFRQPVDIYNPPAEYAYSYDALYAELFWRCVTPEQGGLRVEGYAVTSLRNNMAILNFQVRLFARAAKGEVLAEGWSYGDRLNPSNLEPVPFAIAVPAADDVSRYDLYYFFVVPDGNGGGSVQAPSRVQRVRITLAAGLTWFGTIEDVCSVRWQRKVLPPGA
jgi:hypothetical protein